MSNVAIPEHRLSALRAALDAQGMAGAILSRPEHLFYFSGVAAGAAPSFLIVLLQETVAVAPSPLGGHETVTYTDYDIHYGWCVTEGAATALDQALARSNLVGREVGLELAHLPAVFMPTVVAHIGESRGIGHLLWTLRRIKDAEEIAQIEANAAGNDRAFRAVQEATRPGMTGIDLWAVVYHTLCDVAGGSITLEADVGVGPLGSDPDAKPGPERIAPGDTVFVDIYSAMHGYYADTTRVFTVGRASDRQREIHGILATALAAGEAQLRPGILACDVDAVVRGIIERAGYGPNFPHHSGHAFGIFQQERPYLIPAESMPLKEGMVVTLEPGIFIPGWGGMRLEGDYVIGATGARRLDHFPSELTECYG
ncbi:MAG: aminopeptidase P family protein [Anaerolineales bacterium]|nr:MAG: aminopeptidase P family protein [Anaerolineales bacterium]